MDSDEPKPEQVTNYSAFLREERMQAQESLEKQRLELERLLKLEDAAQPADAVRLREERQEAQQSLERLRHELENILHSEAEEAKKWESEIVKETEPKSGSGCGGVTLLAMALLVLVFSMVLKIWL